VGCRNASSSTNTSVRGSSGQGRSANYSSQCETVLTMVRTFVALSNFEKNCEPLFVPHLCARCGSLLVYGFGRWFDLKVNRCHCDSCLLSPRHLDRCGRCANEMQYLIRCEVAMTLSVPISTIGLKRLCSSPPTGKPRLRSIPRGPINIGGDSEAEWVHRARWQF